MAFQSDPARIVWRVRIGAPVDVVYDALATNGGRASFWAESAEEREGAIDFVFPDGTLHRAPILRAERPACYALRYFGSNVTFTLTAAPAGATDVLLIDEGVAEQERAEVVAGWVSVLMQLKAAVQFNIDLRNHSAELNWRTGYVEN